MPSSPAVLVINSGSSSLKYAVVEPDSGILVADGIIEPRESRDTGHRGRGRPAKLFAITDVGRDHFGHTYDDLASQALRYLRDTRGQDAVRDFAQGRLRELERKCQESMVGSDTS